MARDGRGRGARILGLAVVLLFKAVATAAIVAIPVLGVWAGSSLATYANGPVWLAVLVGLLAFPIAPLAWEGLARWRRHRKGDERTPILTTFDRVVVRTLAVNVLLVGTFLAGWPEITFTALSTRGDWFLEGQEGETAEAMRRRILGAADGLAFLYEAAHENEYAEEEATDDDVTPTPTPAPTEDASGDATAAISSVRLGGSRWPFPAQLHPIVTSMPAEAEQSIESVGRYIADHEPDETQRVKALHDWVADRIAYDVASFRANDIPPQDAEIIFRERKGVCAGYAYLLRALGQAAGVEIVYVVGDARGEGGELSGLGHAWNAVQIDGEWRLIDATWDAGSVGDDFEKRYTTSYFLTPPDVFGLSHFPNEPEWQLRETPLTRGEFNRQPDLRPGLFAAGMRLRSPDRSQVTVHGAIRIEIENPRRHYLLATSLREGWSGDETCQVSGTRQIVVDCALRAPGSYQIKLFENPLESGTYQYIGTIRAISR